MHQHTGHLVLCDHLCHLFIIFQSPDVVDQICAFQDPGRSHRTLVGIQGNGHIKPLLYGPDHRHNSIDLFLCR